MYARSRHVEANPRYQAAVEEQRRREEARRKAAQPKPVVLICDPVAEERARQEKIERDRQMFAAAAERFPLDAADVEAANSIQGIIKEVAEKHGLGAKDILSKTRRRPVIAARFEAIYRVWIEKDPITLTELGRKFGGLDHTTVLNALRRMGIKSALRIREGRDE
ncbi:hypothetical protein BRY73_02925 [Ochrobactrum sp. P6BS-III]|uniref:helix-turn-helix domain-containing protein n=1 Tax=unclassified Ochrobactrum TaxID=239106 RepID=UPI000991F47C|nr:hypothetical protein [Ochrobactrum sp. P6BSIII]OOL20131.1 hypothetical protein BRY73_02925 [Ochrobactrum sp. P6BS-III]